MKKINLFLIILFLFCGNIIAQKLDTVLVRSHLLKILERDQMVRKGGDSVLFRSYIDSTNLLEIESIISTYGWLGKSAVGEKASSTLFYVIQHSNLEKQLKYFPLLQKSVEQGESKPSFMALMHDRILMQQGKKQIYGSQVLLNEKGEQVFYPIEDEKNVNERRAKMGMQSIEEYGKFFGINYKIQSESQKRE